MKILHLAPYFYPAWAYGGTPRAVYEIARRQVALGNDVTVLTTDAYEKEKRLDNGIFDIEGIKVIRMKNLSNQLTWNYHFPIPIINTNLPSKFDIVHVHETRTLLNSLFAAKFSSKKMFYSPWGTLPTNDRHHVLKFIFDSVFLKRLKKIATDGLAQNDHERQLIEKEFKIKTEILPLGIEYNIFTKLPDKLTSRKIFKLNKSDFVFLFLGRFSKVKGLGELLKSFSEVHKLQKNSKLLIVGRDDGFLNEMRDVINNLNLQDSVIVSDPLYDLERLKAYVAADCFAFTPTVYEETSTACLEALACGTPVITTKQAEIPFLTEADGVWQIDNNEQSITNAMLDVMKRKIKVNTSKVKKHFEWNNIVKELNRIYER